MLGDAATMTAGLSKAHQLNPHCLSFSPTLTGSLKKNFQMGSHGENPNTKAHQAKVFFLS